MGKSPKEGTSPSPGKPRPLPSAFNLALGARLRELREERGWSQRELGSKLGILQSKLSKYESGTHQPSLRNLVRLANLVGVTTDYLLTGIGSQVPPLRDERLLDRFRRLGAGGEEMRAIVLSILDAMFELGAYLEQRPAGEPAGPADTGPLLAAGAGEAARSRPARRRRRTPRP
jgi:transcriptional regulator with XRE-family HTH domain